MTVSAAVKLIPRPPARVQSRKMKRSESVICHKNEHVLLRGKISIKERYIPHLPFFHGTLS